MGKQYVSVCFFWYNVIEINVICKNGGNMKKGLKITLIILGVLVSIIILDTLQAKIFDNSPLLKIRENLDGGTLDYIDKGLFVNHYHCNNNEKVTTWKGTKFACSMKESNTEAFDFYLSKPEIHNTIRFNDYFTFNDRKIYLAGNVNEFYIVDEDVMTLKEFIANYNRSLDDSIKMITDKLNLTGALYDGGTTIYKSKDKDITLISCKKMDGNNNIYIGDYSLEYTDDLCD